MIQNHLNKLPPAVCRLLATTNNGWDPITHRELAKRCGLSKTKVADLSTRITWDQVPVLIMEKFASGCGVDLLHQGYDLQRFKLNAKPYMKRATKTQRAFFQKILGKLLADRNKPGGKPPAARSATFA